MAKPKAERNRLFLENWQKGMGNATLAAKYGLSVGGVKALKARLRRKLKGPPQATSPSTSTTTQTSTSTRRMTFWLEEGMIERIKARAAQKGRTASDIVRKLLGKYLESI